MIYNRILEYCMERHIHLHEFEKACNLGNGTVGKWKEDRVIPSLKTLSKIEKKTGIPVKYWIGGEK